MPILRLRPFYLLLCATAFALPPSAPRPPLHPIDEALEGPQSLHTDTILQLIKNWPAGRNTCSGDPTLIQTTAIATPGRPYYVGFKKCMIVKAPLTAVEAVMDDMEHYEELFPGDKRVTILSTEGNKVILGWERKIPIFFVPNVKYEITHLSKRTPTQRIYRTQLRKGDRLLFSDAVVFIETLDSKGTTLYNNYEFYEADYGIGLLGISAVGVDKAWQEGLKGSYLSLLSVRYKAENPDWDYHRIEKERELAIKSYDVENVPYPDDRKTTSK
ncbi:MAG: SRPBCC family protein [Deltaproteobacteria bacterium]|nr:SRPBCC family protein [Deltaproteobacteria bacterium]MBI3295146.1 SRPBCC family protein [Deltaproteobacteria bacterium]